MTLASGLEAKLLRTHAITNGTLFCFTCFLLSKEHMDQFFTGFSDWNHAEIAFNTPKNFRFQVNQSLEIFLLSIVHIMLTCSVI